VTDAAADAIDEDQDPTVFAQQLERAIARSSAARVLPPTTIIDAEPGGGLATGSDTSDPNWLIKFSLFEIVLVMKPGPLSPQRERGPDLSTHPPTPR